MPYSPQYRYAVAHNRRWSSSRYSPNAYAGHGATHNQLSGVSQKSWDDLKRKLKSLPEKVRQRNIIKVLRRAATPLRTYARIEAYKRTSTSAQYLFGNKGNVAAKHPAKPRKKTRGKGGSAYYNLYKSIDIFPNKKNKDYRYVVIGLRGRRARMSQIDGAYYGMMQLIGGTEKNFIPKNFIDKADVKAGEQASKEAAALINKEIEKILAATFR